MATTPNFAKTPRCAIGQISVANPNRDGTGTIETIFTAGIDGSRIDTIVIQAVGTTTAGMVRLFIHDGTNIRLFDEIPVLAFTPSATIPAWSVSVGANANLATGKYPLVLPSGFSLRASTHNAETFNVFVIGGDF